MWDEKEFFEDFVKESEKIKPEEEFIRKLKNLEQKKQRKKFPYARYTAAAAMILICFGIGAFTFRKFGFTAPKSNSGLEYNVDLKAESGEEQIHSGNIGTGSHNDLSQALAQLEEPDMVITNQKGEELSEEEREGLLERLKEARLIHQDAQGAYVSYFCKGQEAFELRIYDQKEDGTINVAVIYTE